MGLMNKMRDHMRYMIIILVLAFIATIIFSWGMDYLGKKGVGGIPSGIVGKINGTEISFDYFNRQVQQEYLRIKEIIGEEPDELRMRRARDEVWNNIVNQTLIDEEIKKNNIYITDKEIVSIISDVNNPPEFLKTEPSFLTDDKFDPQKYRAAFNNPNFPWSYVENIIRLSEPSKKIQNLINSTVRVTSKEVQKQIYLTFLRGNAKYISVSPEEFADVEVKIPDSEIEEYYNSHKDEFYENEKCKLKYVEFPINITKRDTEIVELEMQTILDRLESGEDFSELAKLHSQDPSAEDGGDLGYFSKGDMIEPIEKAAFSAKKGELVGHVKSNYGFHIIKVFDKKSNRKGNIDSVKASHILFKIEPSPETINEINYRASDFSESSKLEGFDKMVQQDSLEYSETPYFMNTGFIPGIGMLYHAVDLIEKLPETTKPLDEVKSLINDILIKNKKMDLAKENITEIHNSINSGKSFEQAAEENSLKIEETGKFGITDYIAGVGNETKFTGAALKLNENEVSPPVETAKAWYLIKLIEKTSDDTTGVGSEKEYLLRGILESNRQVSYSVWIQQLRDNAKIEDFRMKYF